MTKKVWLDAGHGGSDPGAVGNGLRECDLTLAISLQAKTYLLENYEDVEVMLTRETDKTVTLGLRDDLADQWAADVFVSVHINAAGGNGFESFIYNTAGSATVALQNMIHAEIMSAMRKFGNIQDRGKKRANHSVTRETNMPAVLTENLFIDSNDANYLKNQAFIKAISEAHAVGIAKYLGLQLKKQQIKDDITGHWAEKSIRKAIAKKALTGFEDGTFKPNELLTRAQLCSILDRLGVLD